MKIVFFILLTFLAIIGASHIIFEIFFKMAKIENDSSVLLIIPKKNKDFDVELSVRSVVSKMKKLQQHGCCEIVVINDELSYKENKELSILKRDYPYLKTISAEEFKSSFL